MEAKETIQIWQFVCTSVIFERAVLQSDEAEADFKGLTVIQYYKYTSITNIIYSEKLKSENKNKERFDNSLKGEQT